MRPIKFRGKAVMAIEDLDENGFEHENGWVTGNLIANRGVPFIVGDPADWDDEFIALEYWVAVNHESVGQYTNMTGIGGNHLFEKDLLKDEENFIWEIKYKHGQFIGHCDDLMAEQPLNTINLYAKKVGNTYEHKHLLESESK